MTKDDALEKKAQNARDLGLDYEPVQDSGIVTAGGFDPRTQRTWVGLTDEEKQEWIDAMPRFPEPRHLMNLLNIMEARLKEANK